MHVFHYSAECNFKILRGVHPAQVKTLQTGHNHVELHLLRLGDLWVQVSRSWGTGVPIRRKAPSLSGPIRRNTVEASRVMQESSLSIHFLHFKEQLYLQNNSFFFLSIFLQNSLAVLSFWLTF